MMYGFEQHKFNAQMIQLTLINRHDLLIIGSSISIYMTVEDYLELDNI